MKRPDLEEFSPIAPWRDGRTNIPAAALAGGAVLLAGGAMVWAWRRTQPRQKNAPGWPGADPHWAPSDKSGIGTALNPSAASTSLVWFTLAHGVLTEVFHPRLHQPCIRDLVLAVTDGDRFFADERRDTEHAVEIVEGGSLLYRLINTCREGRFRIEKTTIAHPYQDVVLQRVVFTPMRGDLGDYRVYAMLNPHMGLRRGLASTGWVAAYKGRRTLLARRGQAGLALACSAPWGECSVGFVGTSDGWRDLKRHGRLTQTYETAEDGEVMLTGEIDLAACGGEFVLALGFGPEPVEGAYRAWAAVHDDFGGLTDVYRAGWRDWQGGLEPLQDTEPGGRDLYRISTAVLRAHEGKSVPGAAIASLSIPWGEARGDENVGRGGYHMVWPRDLAEIGGGFVAAGARDDARRIVRYLQDTQEADGHRPQNMWVSGETYWSSIQVDETALPVLFFDLTDREGLLEPREQADCWPTIRRAMSYLVVNGPTSHEDRWENEPGFTPFTLATSIAAMLVGAEAAERNGDHRAAAYLRESADAWNDRIEDWTYVEGTELAGRVGVPGHYLRVAPPDDRGQPLKYRGHLQCWYRSDIRHKLPPAEIASCDALAYVRFGLRAADDPRILDTLRVIDEVLKVDTPYGPCWHRYRFDGYGEKPDGSPFDNRSGIGRAWPLLAGERAHYELAAGRRDEAVRLLRAMEGFAGDGGLLPEQVWDDRDIPERGLFMGRPSGSAMPLAWAHAEYIKLRRSLRDGHVFDMPPQTVRRYLVEKTVSPRVIWRPDHRCGTIPAGMLLRVELAEPAVVRWEATGGPAGQAAATLDSGLGIHYTDLATAGLPARSVIRFTLDRTREKATARANGWPIGSVTVAIE